MFLSRRSKFQIQKSKNVLKTIDIIGLYNLDKFNNRTAVIETIYPNDKDWSKGPFVRPPKFKIGFFLMHINGMYVTWTNKDYLIIAGLKKEKIQEFWMEITTTYFQKPILSIREGRKIRNNETENNKDVKFIKVDDKCPACGFKLIDVDRLCPDCGLNFE